jgi:hypothetical protein
MFLLVSEVEAHGDGDPAPGAGPCRAAGRQGLLFKGWRIVGNVSGDGVGEARAEQHVWREQHAHVLLLHSVRLASLPRPRRNQGATVDRRMPAHAARGAKSRGRQREGVRDTSNE